MTNIKPNLKAVQYKIKHPMNQYARFKVVHHSHNFYWILDCDCKEYNTAEQAVSLNFKDFDVASYVCDCMNMEWNNFLLNPS